MRRAGFVSLPARELRFAAAFGISVLVNAGILIGLGSLRRLPLSEPLEPLPRRPVTVAEPPPPPPAPPSAVERETQPGLQQPLPRQAGLPPLEPAPLSEAGLSLPFPAAGGGEGFGWGLGNSIPRDFVSSKALGEANTFDSQPPVLIYQPYLYGYYPPRARHLRLKGRTELTIQLDVRGRVLSAEVLRSTPPDIFDQAAMRVARASRFRPATRDGRPVPYTGEIAITWELE